MKSYFTGLSRIICLAGLFLTTDLPGQTNESYYEDNAAAMSNSDEETSHLNGINWIEGDTTVELLLSFNNVPVRYSSYAFQKPDRIVLDLFRTDSSADFDFDRSDLAAPIVKADYSVQTAEGERFIRLVLFTSRAIPYHIVETPTRLRLVLDWNSRIEKQHIKQAKSRKRFLTLVIAGTGVVTAGTITAVILATRKNVPPSGTPPLGEIPVPDMPTPDDN